MVFEQIQWQPDLRPPDNFLTEEHFRALRPIVALPELRVLMHSVLTDPYEMLPIADVDGSLTISREEFVGQVTTWAEISKINAALIWSSVVLLGQSEMSRWHYLLHMGQADIATFRNLVMERFETVIETWNASNPNGDTRVTQEEFFSWLQADYGLGPQISQLLWFDVDVLKEGFVTFKRYVALGLGRLQGVTLVGFRGFIQSLYPSYREAKFEMDRNRNGVVSKYEFRLFVRSLGLMAQNAEELLEALCSDPEKEELEQRQLDAMTYELGLSALRVLLRSEYGSMQELALHVDEDGDGRVTGEEWASFLARNHVGSQAAAAIFAELDPAGWGYVPLDALRLFRGRLAVCDYRQLVEAPFSAALHAADLDGDGRVYAPEFRQHAQPYCISEVEADELHSQLDLKREGYVDLVAMSEARLPFVLRRGGSLAAHRLCLQSYFEGSAASIVQDFEAQHGGFPAGYWGLVRQAALVAWERPSSAEHLLQRADPFAGSSISKPRYRQLFAGAATLAALRVSLLEAAPGGLSELLARADMNGDGRLTLVEFVSMCQLLGFTAENGRELYARLGSGPTESLSAEQLRPVANGTVSFKHMRLLALNEFPPPDGPALALEAADRDLSKSVDFLEFQSFAGRALAVLDDTALHSVFQALEVAGDGLLRPEQLAFLTTEDFDLPALRHLLVVVLGPGQPSFSAVDASGNGYVDLDEFISWCHGALQLGNESAARVFKSLDLCEQRELSPLQVDLLHRTPDVPLLRALVLARYGRDWRLLSLVDLDGDATVSEAEWRDLGVRLMLAPSEAAPWLHALDFDGTGSLSKAEMRVIAEDNLLLFDFRRLASLAFPNSSVGFELADLDGSGLVTTDELSHFACNHLAMKTGLSVDTIFNMFDRYGVGALPKAYFMVFAGDVDLLGYRYLVQSMWNTPVDAFLAFDVDSDKRLSLQELYSQAATLAITRQNMEALFAQMVERLVDQSSVDMDLYNVVIEGLAGLRVLVRRAFDDPQEALLSVDVERNYGEITRMEFTNWCRSRFHLPDVITSQLFDLLDNRKEGLLRLRHMEFILDPTVSHRLFDQMVESALGDAQTAFEKADGDGDGRLSMTEMGSLAETFGAEPPNVAELFHGLDIEDTGYISREQFQVMARPNHAFRLANLMPEEQRFHVHELQLYSDEACTRRLACDLPIASGYYVNFSGSPALATQKAAEVEFEPASAFDGDLRTRWVSACEPCGAGAAYIGCKFDSELQVRCIEIFQTAPAPAPPGNGTSASGPSWSWSSRRLGPEAKVSAGFRMQTWTGKVWQFLVDIPKPPLWEIDNQGTPLSFKTTIPDPVIQQPERHVHIDERAALDFEEGTGMKQEHLLILSAAAVIGGLLVFCVCCPFLLSPYCMGHLRRNAPERMERRRLQHLELQYETAKMIQALDRAIKDKQVVTDEWGTTLRGVKTREHFELAKRLEKEKKKLRKLEAQASAGTSARLQKDEQLKAKKHAHQERLRRMREAYQSKTIAVDGLALRAPVAVLMELGFEPEMIEAFGLPGFEAIDETAEDESAKEQDEEASEEGEKEELEENVEEDETLLPPDQGLAGEEDPLQIPPRLEEIVGRVVKEGARHRKRRGAMAGIKEGERTSESAMARALKLANSTRADASQEEDEVAQWIGKAAEQRDDPNEESLAVKDFQELDVNAEEVRKQKAVIRAMFDSKRRSTLLTNADVEVKLAEFMNQAQEESSDSGGEEVHFQAAEMRVFALASDAKPSAAALAAAEVSAAREAAAAAAAREEGERERYAGKVYRGMAVRPRGQGTPRRLQLASEVYRASLEAPEVRAGGGLAWGRFAQQGEKDGAGGRKAKKAEEAQAATNAAKAASAGAGGSQARGSQSRKPQRQRSQSGQH